MKLSYFNKIIFSILSILSGSINLLRSLVGLHPNIDLDGAYLKIIMEKVHYSLVTNTSKQRENAQDEYRRRVQELTSR